MFKQIKYRGDNFSYVIADDTTREAAIVDPSYNADALIQFAKNQSIRVEYVIDTHSHPDHAAGNAEIKQRLHAKIVAHKLANIEKDLQVSNGDIIKIGNTSIRVIWTPGHTPDSICLLFDSKVLTGDALFVGECGRTDLPGGSVKDLYNSLFGKLMKLDDNIEVYPGHDYGPSPSSTIGIQKRTNYVLEPRTLEQFEVFMGTP
jgi:glyoxylase-like metal-dependent hydrolase (beta-lactamase superfamily II)